jgi:hypothetical protein
MYSADYLSLYISSQSGATGTLTIPGFGITNTFTVAAGAVTNMSIPTEAMMFDTNVIETYGIHITANQPVSVYAMDYDMAASAAFTGYPTTLLGTNYCVLARPSYGGYGYSSELGIVATADNTTVTITPSPTADLVGIFTPSTNIVLQQGQTYQVNSIYTTDDVTGTLITSDKPVGVFAGASLAYVPDENTTAANPLMQEQLPVNLWGTNVLALSFAERTNGDSYQILAAYSNTVITITGKVITSVVETGHPPWSVTTSNETVMVTITNAGQFYDIIVDGPVQFQGSQPIQVAQFANGTDYDDVFGNEGDPCEILLPPTGHYLETNVTFALPNDYANGDFSTNWLNVIVVQSATNNTFLDFTNAITNFVAIGTSGYYGAQVLVTNGAHTVTSSQPVGVEVYGWGYADAYGYFGGVVK